MTTGCLTITIDRIGGIVASATRVAVPTGATATRVGGMTANLGLVCGTSIGVESILWASDAMLITIDNGYLVVTEN